MPTILVAADKNGVIGYQGKLPWSIASELRYFREVTIGSTIIMGRKTWESLPKKPLDKRLNVVITKQKIPDQLKIPPEGPIYYNNFFSAIGNTLFYGGEWGKRIFIIGGASIYKLALQTPIVDKILLSRIPGNYRGDTYFPELKDWILKSKTKHTEFVVEEYERIPKSMKEKE